MARKYIALIVALILLVASFITIAALSASLSNANKRADVATARVKAESEENQKLKSTATSWQSRATSAEQIVESAKVVEASKAAVRLADRVKAILPIQSGDDSYASFPLSSLQINSGTVVKPLAELFAALGLPGSLWAKMESTRALDGKQVAEGGGFRFTWSYDGSAQTFSCVLERI